MRTPKTETVDSEEESTQSSKSDESQSEINNSYNYLLKQYESLKKSCQMFVKKAGIHQKYLDLKNYLSSNPILLYTFAFITVTIGLPLLFFSIFIIVNIAIAFTGFVVIEAMVLTTGITLLCCVLFFLITALIMVGIFFAFTYYATYYFYKTGRQLAQSTT